MQADEVPSTSVDDELTLVIDLEGGAVGDVAAVEEPVEVGACARVTVDALADVVGPRPGARWQHAVKRTADVVLALALLVVSAPALVVLAVLIAADSPGGALFRQERVGLGGRTFTFYKFRTMWVDARERHPELYAYAYEDDEIPSLYFKYPHDPRLTPVGTWLRRTSLDELPNLLNVLRGQMSLVGPRPEIPEMVPYYAPDELAVFGVKPGLTGLAQISGRNILPFRETNQLDLAYARDWSLSLDLRILLRTPVAVVRMLGAL